MKIVTEANKYGRDTAKRINTVIKRHSKQVTEIVKRLTAAGVNVNNVWIDSTSYNIDITGTKDDLHIMFGTLRKCGLEPGTRPEEKQATYCTFWRSEGFSIWVSFGSTTCKRVQVGTKMQEVPVYETVCEE